MRAKTSWEEARAHSGKKENEASRNDDNVEPRGEGKFWCRVRGTIRGDGVKAGKRMGKEGMGWGREGKGGERRRKDKGNDI